MRTKLLDMVEELIKQGFIILVICQNDWELLRVFHDKITNYHLSKVMIWHCVDNYNNNNKIKRLVQDDMNEIISIYHMYDFCDRITIVTDGLQYGNLYNYVRNGLLTKEEMVDALLHNI